MTESEMKVRQNAAKILIAVATASALWRPATMMP